MTIESSNAAELIEIALRICSDSQKLKEEEEEELRFLVLDMQFCSNYFFRLGKNKWWKMKDEDINRLAYNFPENRKLGHDILDSIQDFLQVDVDDSKNRVWVLEEKMSVWREKVIQEYSVLLNAELDEVNISCKETGQFITSIFCIATELLNYKRDSGKTVKQKIYVSWANLKFLRGFVRFMDKESKGMRSCILDYTYKVEVVLFRYWAGNGNIWDFHYKFIDDCYSNDLLDYISSLSLRSGVVGGHELEDGIKLLHERLAKLAEFPRGDLSLDMRVLYVRGAACLGFFCAFSLRDSSEQMIEHAKFQLLIMTTSLYICIVELTLMEKSNHEDVKVLKILRECVKYLEDVYLEEDNSGENNVNQILFVLDIIDVATEMAQLHSPNDWVDREEEKSLHMDQLILQSAIVMAEQVLNVDSNFKMLKEGLRLLRFILTTMKDSAYENLLESDDELVKDTISLVYKLLDNNDCVSDLLRELISWETNVASRYMQIRRSSHFTHPRTDRLGFIDSLELDVTLFSGSLHAFSSWMKYQIPRALKDLKSCSSLLNDIVWDIELDNLVSRLSQAAYDVEFVFESFAVECTWTKRIWISDLFDEIKQISMKIKDVRPSMPGTTDRALLQPVDNNSIPFTNEVVVVGMKKQKKAVRNQLIRGSKNFGVVSIVGMGGLGKTTLAKKVFNSCSVQQSFDIRAWCTISKVYRMREVLLELLGYVEQITPEIRRMTDDDLFDKLRKLLLRKSYLIVMDDMWDMLAWDDMQKSFPREETRSRILFTSRINYIASKTGYGFEPYSLDSLSEEQSWELLERKVFQGQTYPHLCDVGKEIAKKCKGLPLAIVVVSGLLSAKLDMSLDWWEQVAEHLNSMVVGNSKNIIDLSYRYLPDNLKPCFLYFGAFKEDERVLVSNLMDLWIAEGFILKKEDKSVNQVANEYLMELVTRNLVNIAERTSMGGIKSCHVHDLLHELCRARAKEESFLHVVKNDEDSTVEYEHRRVCIHSTRHKFSESRPSGQCVRSLLLFPDKEEIHPLDPRDVSFISINFKLLRTLKLDSINVGNSLPDGFELLIHLRFLAVLSFMESIPDSIKHLSNLEFFYLKGLRGEIEVPQHRIWCLKKLRNLQVRARFVFKSLEETLDELDNLECLSAVFLPYEESTEHILQRLPRLHKLKCIFTHSWNDSKTINRFPSLESLNQLETLKVLYHGALRHHHSAFSFPATLKKLTLSKFRLPWKDIAQIGALPCLEVLKLLFKAFEGQEWKTIIEDEEGNIISEVIFEKLRYLKLESLDIVQWTTSCDSFPSLEKLVLQTCKKLKEVPIAFGESNTLEMIHIRWCNKFAAKSVKDIQGELKDTVGRELNVLIQPPDF